MDSGALLVPAKLNVSLEVLSRRPDGYHGIRSVTVPVALCDTLRWRPAAEFSFSCSDPSLATRDNLAWRAAAAIGLEELGVELRLDKVIPAGAGLGGGSSDAAAVLLAGMGGAFGPQPVRDWQALATRLGSDVPLFLAGAPALVEGRGERVTALGAGPAWHAVVIDPAVHVATGEAYALLDRQGERPTRPRAQSIGVRLATALQRHDFDAVVALLHNDFDPVVSASQPRVAACAAACAQLGLRSTLTGSGAARFVLFAGEAEARAAAAALRAPALLPAGARVFEAPFFASTGWRSETAAVAQV